MKIQIKTGGGIFWLAALVLILVLGIYLTKDNSAGQTVQTFSGGYQVPNRSFTDLFVR